MSNNIEVMLILTPLILIPLAAFCFAVYKLSSRDGEKKYGLLIIGFWVVFALYGIISSFIDEL
jgi:hypothetical protein